MSGMEMPGDGFINTDEDIRRVRGEDAAYEAQQAAWQEQNAREANTAWERLQAILRGERPTRETNEEWRRRKAAEAAAARNPGMLPIPTAPAGDPYFYYNLRNQLPRNDPRQAALGPLEHEQFVQEAVQQNPLMALPMGLVGIPGYTLGKAAGMIQGTRSPASLDELLAGYRGLWTGLAGR